ncbi:sulfite exporter TauE/SafE family protein [Pseudomonas sp. SIMBA_077]
MLIDFAMYIALGLALGALGGLFGIGGGLIAIPVLGLWFGLDQQIAQGTALVMSVPNVFLALYRYNQRNKIDLRQALPLVGMSFCFAWLGAMLAVGVEGYLIRWGFVVFLLCVTLHNLIKLYSSPAQAVNGSRYGWAAYGVLGAVAGTTGGLFGVGGAVVAAPVLTSLFGTTQVMAQGLSLALAAPSTAVTLLTYAVHDEVNWLMGVPLAIGGLLSISWGVKVAHALPERMLRGLYCAFLLLCAGLLAIKA